MQYSTTDVKFKMLAHHIPTILTIFIQKQTHTESEKGYLLRRKRKI